MTANRATNPFRGGLAALIKIVLDLPRLHLWCPFACILVFGMGRLRLELQCLVVCPRRLHADLGVPVSVHDVALINIDIQRVSDLCGKTPGQRRRRQHQEGKIGRNSHPRQNVPHHGDRHGHVSTTAPDGQKSRQPNRRRTQPEMVGGTDEVSAKAGHRQARRHAGADVEFRLEV